jgi:micrococcal nuclease
LRLIVLKVVILLVLISLTTCAYAKELSPKISYFYDGDTVKIQDVLIKYKLRLTDIDSPWRNPTYGKMARRALTKLSK